MNSRYGEIEVFPQDYIGKAVDIYGEWAWIEVEFVTALVLELLRDNRLVAPCWYDVGSFIGTFSLGLNSVFQKALGKTILKGVAIEASGSHYELLNRNIGYNAGNSVNPVLALVGPKDEVRIPENVAENRGGNRYLPIDFENNSNDVHTNEQFVCIPLWALRQKFGPYGLLKLDVEGMEFKVIQTDQQWIRENKPVIYAECNDAPESIKLFDQMKWLGYEVYYFAFPAFNPENFKGKKEDALFNGAYEAALVAVNGSFVSGEMFPCRGCLLKQMNTRMDVVEAMWFTPRYVPQNYRARTIVEMRGAIGKLTGGRSFEEFAAKLSSGSGLSAPAKSPT